MEKWVFVGAPNADTYTWYAAHINGGVDVSDPFPTLAAAIVNAVNGGFDPSRQHWIVEAHGRTTHYRRGKMPVILPFGEEPAD